MGLKECLEIFLEANGMEMGINGTGEWSFSCWGYISRGMLIHQFLLAASGDWFHVCNFSNFRILQNWRLNI